MKRQTCSLFQNVKRRYLHGYDIVFALSTVLYIDMESENQLSWRVTSFAIRQHRTGVMLPASQRKSALKPYF